MAAWATVKVPLPHLHAWGSRNTSALNQLRAIRSYQLWCHVMSLDASVAIQEPKPSLSETSNICGSKRWHSRFLGITRYHRSRQILIILHPCAVKSLSLGFRRAVVRRRPWALPRFRGRRHLLDKDWSEWSEWSEPGWVPGQNWICDVSFSCFFFFWDLSFNNGRLSTPNVFRL